MTTINTKHCGKLTFYIEGTRSTNEVAILTVHDIGCNHSQYDDFLKHPSMETLAPRCVWFNVDLPGQGIKDVDLPSNFNYPTMQQIADDLLECIGILSISHLILFGEGAGANILARMAMTGDERVLGAVLLNCVGSTPNLVNSLKDKIIGWKLSTAGMTSSTENYLVVHRFGVMSNLESDEDLGVIIGSYKKFVRDTFNSKNLHGYVNSYMNRSNLIDKNISIRCPMLFISGSLANYSEDVKCLYEDIQVLLKNEPDRKRYIEFMEIDNCANVIVERADQVAESLQYFLQGQGLVGSAPSRRMSSTVRPTPNRKISMEDYDSPKGVSNITYNPKRKYSASEN